MGLISLIPPSITQGAVGNLITAIFKPARAIGPFATQITIEEIAHDELEITNHPVEYGAMITDHSFKRPAEVLIRCGFTNSSLASLVTEVAGILNLFVNGSVGPLNYANQIYAQMLALQQSRIPFSVTTGKRSYKNMLIKSLQQTTDEKTENVLMLTVHCQEIIIVSTTVSNSTNTNGVAPTPTNPAQTNPLTTNGSLSLVPGNPTLSSGSFPITPAMVSG